MLRELRRFLADLDEALAPFDEVDERFVEGFIFVLSAIRRHKLLESEPETILPHLTVQGSPFIAVARGYLAARLVRDHEGDRTPEEMEIVVRPLLSHILTPRTLVDLDNPDEARAFALRHLRPVLAGAPPDRPDTTL